MNWFLNIWNRMIDGLPEYAHEADYTGYIPEMAALSLLVGLGGALLVLTMMVLSNKFRGGRWNVSGKLLTTLFCVTLMLGFIVYEIGIYTGKPLSLLLNAPIAMIHAFEMFFLESDAAALNPAFHHNLTFMALFSLAHFLAAAVSMIFVIKHFGFNIIAGFRMLFEAYFRGKRRETYVFWGMNEPSYLLARSVRQNHANDKDYRIIVVRTGGDGERKGVRNGMERLFNFLSLKNNDLERLQDLDCLTTNTFTDLSKLNVDEMSDGDTIDVFKRLLNLRQLSRILLRKTSSAIHLFFLDDDASANIQSITNLKKDRVLLAFAGDKEHGAKREVTFYCHARYNNVNRVIEDEQMLENVEVKVVDSSHISIEQLKQDVKLHPVSYVNIEPDATVSTAFNALVVGFGEIGIDAVRFLYEFGTFVKHGARQSGEVERADFHCDVVDSAMSVIAGPFLANAPAITTDLTLKDGTPMTEQGLEADGTVGKISRPLVSLHEMDIMGVDFYKKLETWVKTVNYIVIATEDDEHNMTLAVRIFKLAVMYRDGLERFRILVRVKSDNDGHIRRTAEHYNRLWAAERHAEDESRRIHQKTVKNDVKLNEPITVFGMNDAIYTYDYIISDRLVKEAKAFKERYDASIAALRQKDGQSGQNEISWDAEYKDLMQLTSGYKGFSPTYTGMMRLRRIQSQNRQNCFHQLTKQQLAKSALGERLYASLADMGLVRNENETTYRCPQQQPNPSVIAVLDVIAQNEHLRWCASHEILGYRNQGDADFKNEAKLLHGCLKPWSQLSDPVKSYDYNVVDVSLGIITARQNLGDRQV